MFIKNTALIIPTRNRPVFLKRIFKNLGLLSKEFKEILIIDSSDIKNIRHVKDICIRNNVKYFHTKASTAHQRNFGLLKKKKSKFTMFLDDDVIIPKSSFYEMDKVMKKERNNYDAFAFNLILKEKKNFLTFLKQTKLVKFFNLYSDSPGEVLKNGWQTKIYNLKENTPVSWIYSGASIFLSKKIFKKYFDVTFGVYSYLEDLDFALQLTKKKKKILVVSKAIFKDPNYVNRNGVYFGWLEIRNRFLIVIKHSFNLYFFFFTSCVKFVLSLILSLKGDPFMFLRGVGNLIGIVTCLCIKILKLK